MKSHEDGNVAERAQLTTLEADAHPMPRRQLLRSGLHVSTHTTARSRLLTQPTIAYPVAFLRIDAAKHHITHERADPSVRRPESTAFRPKPLPLQSTGNLTEHF